MSRTPRLVPAAVAACALLLSAPAAAQQRYSLSGREVVLYNVAGELRVERGSGPDVEVEVTAGGRDAGRLSVAVDDIDGRRTLRVIYPDDEVSYEGSGWGGNTTIRVRDDGTFGREGRRVRIHRRGGGLEAHADLRVLVPEGKRVALFLGVGGAEANDVTSDLLFNVSASSVHVRGLRGALLIDTGSGGVEVADVEGDVGVDTGSGGVTLTGVHGRTVKLDTGSGTVRLSDVRADDLNVDTGSGGIRAAGVSAPKLKFDTGSGSITAELLADVDDAVFSTGSGGVRLTIPEALGARLDVGTGSGGINVDVPVRITHKERSELHGLLGDGQGRLYVDTGSGSVSIRRRP